MATASLSPLGSQNPAARRSADPTSQLWHLAGLGRDGPLTLLPPIPTLDPRSSYATHHQVQVPPPSADLTSGPRPCLSPHPQLRHLKHLAQLGRDGPLLLLPSRMPRPPMATLDPRSSYASHHQVQVPPPSADLTSGPRPCLSPHPQLRHLKHLAQLGRDGPLLLLPSRMPRPPMATLDPQSSYASHHQVQVPPPSADLTSGPRPCLSPHPQLRHLKHLAQLGRDGPLLLLPSRMPRPPMATLDPQSSYASHHQVQVPPPSADLTSGPRPCLSPHPQLRHLKHLAQLGRDGPLLLLPSRMPRPPMATLDPRSSCGHHHGHRQNKALRLTDDPSSLMPDSSLPQTPLRQLSQLLLQTWYEAVLGKRNRLLHSLRIVRLHLQRLDPSRSSPRE